MGREKGAAAVEFALVLPLLLVILLGIIDFGLYFYNDLQLTHVARDAARHLSVDKTDQQARDAIATARVINTSVASNFPPALTQGDQFTITVNGTYTFLTPLPRLVGMGRTLAIKASVVMRRE